MKALLKSFITGYLDIFRFAPIFPPMEQKPGKELPGPEQDAANLAGDWQRVGDYLRNAMSVADAEINRS